MSANDRLNWCPYPWNNLNTNTDGSLKLCCAILENHHFTDKNETLNFGKDNIEKIWNSDYVQKIRQDLLDNKKPKACDVCWKLEDKKIKSSRIAILEENIYSKNLKVEDYPNSLELRLGNKCNLKCLTCWSVSSSSIYEERKKALNEKQSLPDWLSVNWNSETKYVDSQNYDWYNSEKFDENFHKIAKGLKRLYLTGGEPTLIKSNIKILKSLEQAKNKDCHISFTTNLSLWNEEFYQQLEKFNNCEIQISIDGYGELNEYIRNPSDWLKIDSNLNRLIDLEAGKKIKIYTVFSILNFLWIDELIEYLIKKFSNRKAEWVPIVLQAPEFLSTDCLSENLKLKAVEKLKNILIKNNNQSELEYRYGISILENQLNSRGNETVEIKKKAVEYLETHNQIRKNKHPYADTKELLGL